MPSVCLSHCLSVRTSVTVQYNFAQWRGGQDATVNAKIGLLANNTFDDMNTMRRI